MNNLYTRKTLVAFLIITGNLANAQYYPGGLGNSNLKLWLTGADATTLKKSSGTQAANGDYIAKWMDKSGNGNHAVQTASGTQPLLQTNALNGNSAVIFENYNELLTGPTGAYQSIVGVRNLVGSGHYQYFFSSPANADFSIRGGGQSSVYTDGPNVNDWSYNTGTPPAQWTNGVQTLNASTTNHIIVDVAQAPTNATYSINSTFMSRGMNGNDPVYEILAYNTALNNTQRNILENYESATWGLESALPTSGYTKFTPPATASYNKNLVGIGYTSSTDNVLSTTSGSTDGLGFSSTNTGFLNTTGFLMAADNGQTNSVITNATIPGVASSSSLSRWNKSWYVQLSGGNAAGQLTIKFSFMDYNSSTPSGSASFALLYNATDGSFASGTNSLMSASAISVSGNTVSFTVTASNTPTGYYTIVYSNTPITLPLTITDFTATGDQGSALLRWTIEQAMDVDHINVQRSADGVSFSTIGAVNAQANIAGSADYIFTDNKPETGVNYYRLEIVNADGSVAYSGIRTLEGPAPQSATISIYPNPASDILHVVTAGTGSVGILVIDAQGRVVRQVNAASGNTIDVPVNDLPKGIYFAELLTGQSKFTRTFLKN